MANANISRARRIGGHPPWIVHVPNATGSTAAKEFLAGLITSPFGDAAITPEEQLLWAATVGAEVGAEAGTSYVLSPEAYKRLQAQRFVE